MNLVIVESPAKAKTINKYLGKNYIVMASKGHLVDLPKSKLSIDVDNNFKPGYVVTNPKSLTELKQAFKKADKLILAVDLDREGEAIGWHVAQELKVIDEKGKHIGKKPVERIVFSEITKEAIEDAIKHPRDIDINLFNAQQARRLLDRIVGYKLSPLLWKKIAFGLSAGRVQSVAVKLIVDKEDERNKFNKEEYWSISANLSKEVVKNVTIKYQETNSQIEIEDKDSSEIVKDLIKFDLYKVKNNNPDLKKKNDCEKIVSDLYGNSWIITDIVSTQSIRNPKPPFITSTLQQTAVNWLGFTARRTMSAAQKLYEAGHITYMRTDSVHMSDTAVSLAKDYILKTFGEKYYPGKSTLYKSSNKSAQEAHECIRPSNFFNNSDKLGLEGDMQRVYDLIWQRTIASQMTKAIIESSALVIDISEYQFRSTGKRIIFDGFLKVYPEKFNENMLPKLEKGKIVYVDEILSLQHFTQPPARYSEATIIKKLEELGIGRPSTYASIISTIQQRKYVDLENKYLKPTDTGIVVNKLLDKYFNNIVDYNFTANMENNLDKVAEGKLDWIKMLKDFYFPFDKKVTFEDKNITRNEFTELGESNEKCPICGGPMLIKLGRYGRFLSCKNYPTCKGMLSIQEDTEGAPADLTIDLEKYEGAPQTEDGREYVLKSSRFGKFWAHPDYPKVKDPRSILLKERCPLSGHNLVERKGKWGKTFIGCSNYPNCKYIKGAPLKAINSDKNLVPDTSKKVKSKPIKDKTINNVSKSKSSKAPKRAAKKKITKKQLNKIPQKIILSV